MNKSPIAITVKGKDVYMIYLTKREIKEIRKEVLRRLTKRSS